MTETPLPTCDRCRAILGADGVRAVHKDGRELLLCRVHERDHEDALKRQGWSTLPLVTPEPTAGPKIGGSCAHCGGPQVHRFVKASPSSPAVKIIRCQRCDLRTCNQVTPTGKCDGRPTNPDDPICPKGHPLNGAGL